MTYSGTSQINTLMRCPKSLKWLVIMSYVQLKNYPVSLSLGSYWSFSNRLDEMCDVLEKLHEYVPAINVKEYYDLFDDSCLIEVEEIFHRILFGGDQLTVARARGSSIMRCDM